MRGRAIGWTDVQIKFVRLHVEHATHREIAALVNRNWGLGVSEQHVNALCKRQGFRTARTGHFPKGNIPANKGRKGWSAPGTEATRFQKGHRPVSTVPVGTYRRNNPRLKRARAGAAALRVAPLWKVKCAEPNVWEYVHRLSYIAEHGEIPAGGNIVFRNGDENDCSAENLVCLTRGELGYLNRHLRFSRAPAGQRDTLIAMAQLKCAIGRRQHGLVLAPNGQTKSLREHAADYGLQPGTVLARVQRRGWSIAEALTTPINSSPERLLKRRSA